MPHGQLPADLTVMLYYSLEYSHLTYFSLACERLGVPMLLRLSVLTSDPANYTQITTKISSLFTQFMISLFY